jgi:hypothetical protein
MRIKPSTMSAGIELRFDKRAFILESFTFFELIQEPMKGHEYLPLELLEGALLHFPMADDDNFQL